MSHSHHHHPHSTATLIGVAFWINAGFMIVEVVGGLWTNSLALLADAGHMATDVFSLGLTWLAIRLSAKAADRAYTYGYRRAQVLAALCDAIVLGAILVFIISEAIERLRHPEPILSNAMLIVAIIGLFANFISGWIIFSRRDESLNVRGAFLHLMGDTLGSVAAIVGALIISWTGWVQVDPILSLIISLLIGISAWGLMRDSVDVLMERAPRNVNVEKLIAALKNLEGVEDVHDLHVWELDDGQPLASVHIVVPSDVSGEQYQTILSGCCRLMREDFSIPHATIQVESLEWTDCSANCN